MKDVVIVPAHREVASLSALLSSVAALARAARVVVAVDGAHPATAAAARSGGAEVVLLADNVGSYAARNAALAHAYRDCVPDMVLFTDADCVVGEGWLEGHRAALRHAQLSAGAVRFTYRSDRPSPAEWVDSVRHLQQERYATQDGYGATCNLAVRGDLLATHRFDGSLRTGGDAELCRRLVASGAQLVYTPEAVIEHPARGLRELWIKADRVVAGLPSHMERWRALPLPRRLPTLAAWRRGRASGLSGGVAWGIAVSALDWALAQRVRAAVVRSAKPT